MKQQRCSFTSGPRGKGGLHSLQSLSLLALILQLAKPHSQEEIKILVTELSLQPKVNGQTCLHTPKSPCSLSRGISHRKRQTETSVLSSCQTLHHSLDLSSVLPLLCSSRDSGRLFWKSSTREQFHTCAQIYKSLQQHTEAGTWSSALPACERAVEAPKHGFQTNPSHWTHSENHSIFYLKYPL